VKWYWFVKPHSNAISLMDRSLFQEPDGPGDPKLVDVGDERLSISLRNVLAKHETLIPASRAAWASRIRRSQFRR
jgi:hypothetical protein